MPHAIEVIKQPILLCLVCSCTINSHDTAGNVSLQQNNPPHISFLLLQLKRVGLFNYFPQKYNFTLMTHYCANDTFESQFELCSLGLPTQTNQRLVRVQHLTF